MKRVEIIIRGRDNVVDLSGGANYLSDCCIYICGNNNKITIGQRNILLHGEFYIEDDYNEIIFGNHNRILGKTHVACCEGTKVVFGCDSLFSTDVTFRTSDSHSILDLSGNRINMAKSIVVKDRVWFGNKTIILKGLEIGEDSIIGSGSVCTKSVPRNTIVAGNPATVIKTGVRWDITRK